VLLRLLTGAVGEPDGRVQLYGFEFHKPFHHILSLSQSKNEARTIVSVLEAIPIYPAA
jgi:hypothetical protein